jgi:hypothetical protein
MPIAEAEPIQDKISDIMTLKTFALIEFPTLRAN